MQKSDYPFIRGFLIITASWWIGGAIVYAAAEQVLPKTLTGNYLLLNSSFIPFFLSAILVIRYLFRIPIRTFITDETGRVSTGRSLWFIIGWCVLFTLSAAGEYLLTPQRFTMTQDLGIWLSFLPLLILITPLQTFTEELFFRAYIGRWMEYHKTRKALMIVLSGIIFLSVHLLNPEISQYGGTIWIYLYYLLFGSGMMAIAIIDRSFFLPICIHTVNNLFSVAIVNYEGTVLQAPSLFIDQSPDSRVSVITLFLGIIGTIWLLRKQQD